LLEGIFCKRDGFLETVLYFKKTYYFRSFKEHANYPRKMVAKCVDFDMNSQKFLGQTPGPGARTPPWG
jgi:hypothetical protein